MMQLLWIHALNTQIKKILQNIIGGVDKKVPDTNRLVTTTVLNTKISEVEKKIPDNSKYIILLLKNLIS